MVLRGKLDNATISLINAYNPPEEGPDLIKKTVDIIVSESQGITIKAGDFNLSMDANLDFEGKRNHNSQIAAKLLKRAREGIIQSGP